MSAIPPFSELIRSTTREAVHLEMRDSYTPGDPDFAAWRDGEIDVGVSCYPDWSALIAAQVARGVRIRRARIVSEPVSDYIRFEYAITAATNVAAGEEVRWLPRRRASDLALPGNDFWLFDDGLVRVHHFSGDGEIVEDELSRDAGLVTLCRSAFEAVWARAVDHRDYRL
ncbi:hypothetical protein LO762_11470 [Actinocorallia sp. API 0066]|uniref:DUF6879 family protein n=1 Tax=Actinocorallia sp. API 0066 TaxID=2896846 RepID=UPI001E3E7A7A|nr:DUF6879 family protein [Actinocorallia sp. API 0066]MCD0449803.1 hypothetical protein [Actinocorallia sp. API 0066]